MKEKRKKIQEKNSNKKSKNKGRLLLVLGSALIGALCGVISGMREEPLFDMGILGFLVLMAEMLVAMYVQIIIHEAGHLVAGLLSEYTFSSFRIGSVMWMKVNGRICIRRYSIPGTGGQCLMNPPDMEDGTLSYMLYNLGGSLMNLATFPLCMVVGIIVRDVPYVSPFFFTMGIVGLGYAMMNGIPLKLGTINNDGYNVLDLRRSDEAKKSFWVQMKVAEELAKGIRLRDMPKNWFTLPDENEWENSLATAIPVLQENRLMDQHAFEEAKELIDRILHTKTGIIGLHRNLLICDRIYLALIEGEGDSIIDTYYTKDQKKYMKQMKSYPSVLRTEYAYALLYKKDRKEAEKIRETFDMIMKKYPYSADVESEKELMDICNRD